MTAPEEQARDGPDAEEREKGWTIMQVGQPRGRLINRLFLLRTGDLERHSTAQVNQLQQEQEVLASAADYADQGPTDLPAAFENLLVKDVKTLQLTFTVCRKSTTAS